MTYRVSLRVFMVGLVATALLLASSMTLAKQWPPTVDPVLPWRGTYYDFNKPGTGINLDVDSHGVLVAMFYTYDADGNPFYYIAQGDYEANTDGVSLAGGDPIGTMSAQLYYPTGGECIGEGCTYQYGEEHMVDKTIHMTWIAPQYVHVTIGEQSWDMRGGELSVGFDEFLEGNWLATRISHTKGTMASISTEQRPATKIRMSDLGPYLGSQTGACGNFEVTPVELPNDAMVYRVVSGALSTDYDPEGLIGIYLYFVPDTMQSGSFVVKACVDGSPPMFTGYTLPSGETSRIFKTGPHSFRYISLSLLSPDTEEVIDLRYNRLPDGAEMPNP